MVGAERNEQSARAELQRTHEASRSALHAQHRMEAAALKALGVWYRQTDEPDDEN